MPDPKIIAEWRDKAEEDFSYACASLEDKLPFFSQICYHFQQAAEKYLKTYIMAYELEFKEIHNLLILLKICQKQEPAFSRLQKACELLNSYYIETRYPVHWPTQYNENTAKEARKAAEQIRDFVGSKLN